MAVCHERVSEWFDEHDKFEELTLKFLFCAVQTSPSLAGPISQLKDKSVKLIQYNKHTHTHPQMTGDSTLPTPAEAGRAWISSFMIALEAKITTH